MFLVSFHIIINNPGKSVTDMIRHDQKRKRGSEPWL